MINRSPKDFSTKKSKHIDYHLINKKNFNIKFDIRESWPADDSTRAIKDFLKTKLNQAFRNPYRLAQYKSALENATFMKFMMVSNRKSALICYKFIKNLSR